MLNAYHGNKKVVIVNINDNAIAHDLEKVLAANNFNNVVSFSAPKSYPGYFKVAEAEGVYTIFVEESKSCKVQPCLVEGFTGKRLGQQVRRDLTESQKAKDLFKHHLKMLGMDPNLLGSYKIDFEEVKDIPWFYTDETPMLYITVPNVEGVADAICNSIKDYFISK